MKEMTPEEEKIRKCSRRGNFDDLEQELLLLSFYDVIYTDKTANYKKIDPEEERRICSIYKNFNDLNKKNISNFVSFFSLLSKKEDLELEGNYTGECHYEHLHKRQNELKNKLKSKINKITNNYTTSLKSLSKQKNFLEYLSLSGHLKEQIKYAQLSGYDFSKLSTKIEIQNKQILEDKTFREYIYDVDNIFNNVIDDLNSGLYEEPILILNEVENFLKTSNIYNKYINSKNTLIENYVDKLCVDGFKYAQERNEIKMNELLSAAGQIMSSSRINLKKLVPIQNTLYKENIHWSISKLDEEAQKKEPNYNFVQKLEHVYIMNSSRLRQSSIDSYDNEFREKNEREFNRISYLLEDKIFE